MLQEGTDATIKVLRKKEGGSECGNYRGISVVAHAGKAPHTMAFKRLGNFCEEARIFQKEQCRFQRQRSTKDMMDMMDMMGIMDMMLAVRRLHE